MICTLSLSSLLRAVCHDTNALFASVPASNSVCLKLSSASCRCDSLIFTLALFFPWLKIGCIKEPTALKIQSPGSPMTPDQPALPLKVMLG